jgi:hypothetical protein
MALDLRPRVVFHTSAGAVVVTVDPSTLLGGQVQIPGVGNVPYDVNVWDTNIGGPSMTVHLPVYGDSVIPLLPSGSTQPMSIPGLGDVTVEVVFGPVDLPPESLANVGSIFALTGAMPYVLIGVAAFMFLRPKRNPSRYRRNPGEVSAHCAGGRHGSCAGVISHYVGPRLIKKPCACKCHTGSRFIGQLWPPIKKNPCGNPMCCP